MKYNVDKEEKYTLIKLEEEKLDSTLAPTFKSELVTLHAEGTPNLVIDLTHVKYIDSSGLSAILVGHRIFAEDNKAFILAGPTDHVLKLIKISQLESVLDVLPTVHEAVESVFMHELEKDLKGGEEE